LLPAASAGAAEQNITEVIESARTSGANFVALGNSRIGILLFTTGTTRSPS
jgi:hypothetical protein